MGKSGDWVWPVLGGAEDGSGLYSRVLRVGLACSQGSEGGSGICFGVLTVDLACSQGVQSVFWED